MISASEFLNIAKGNAENNCSVFRIGKIPSNYTTGNPTVIFDGEDTAGQKTYRYLSSYTPVANNRVLLAKVAGSYVILGKIV